MKTKTQLRAEFSDNSETVQAICGRATDEGRELSDSEKSQVDKLLARNEAIVEDDLPRADKAEVNRQAAIAKFDQLQATREDLYGPKGSQRYERDAQGNEVKVFASTEKMAPAPNTLNGLRNEIASTPNPLGECIKAAVIGDFSRSPHAIKAALSEGTNSAGGFTVNDQLVQGTLDKARNASAFIQAGAVTLRMNSPTTNMVKLESDPTFASYSELDVISSSDMVFGQVQLNARKVAVLMKVSRELAYDSVGFVQMVESYAARALAAEIDRLCLQGTGVAPQPEGLLNDSNISETGSIGVLSYEDLAAAVKEVREANYEPSAVILNTGVHENLKILAGGDGSNSAKNWLGAPPALEGVNMLSTGNMPSGKALVGDFGQAVLGIREDVRIESSTDASFDDDALMIKLAFRFDVAALVSDAFHKLDGISG